MKTKKYELDGEMYTIAQIVKLKNMNYSTVARRIKEGVISLDGIEARKIRKVSKKNTNYKLQNHNLLKPNWKSSMTNDELGHWALINKALSV